MAKPKGKLSEEQKRRMQEGRRAARERAKEGLIDTSDDAPRTKKKAVEIIGYTFSRGDRFPCPVFASERDHHKGRLYATNEEAKVALAKRMERDESRE